MQLSTVFYKVISSFHAANIQWRF